MSTPEKGNLVRLLDLDKDFIIDLKYATEDNFTGHQIYASAECYIDEHTAKLLIKARDLFRKDEYRVKIFDAYRPISAQARFWEVMPDDRYVATPPDMEKLTEFRPTHMNGQCVDVTLTDLEGREIVMPTPFDELTERAALGYPGHFGEGKKNGEYLKRIMEQAGFEAYEGEWWHFYDMQAEEVPYLDYRI